VAIDQAPWQPLSGISKHRYRRRFDILNVEAASGAFATIINEHINPNWKWELEYKMDPSVTDMIAAYTAPEPATLSLLTLGTMMLLHRRR